MAPPTRHARTMHAYLQLRNPGRGEARDALTAALAYRRLKTVIAVDEDVVALTLASANGDPLPRWYAGSHVDVLLPSGRIRQYSLCGDPADQSVYRIAVRRILSGGGGSIEIHDDLRVGDLLPIRGPRNAFPLVLPGVADGRDPSAKQLRFVAGGIGITPILPMLSHAERLGYDWSAIYTGRSRASIPFLRELEGYGDRITVRRSKHSVRFLHPRGWSYFDTLREKLHWNEGGS